MVGGEPLDSDLISDSASDCESYVLGSKSCRRCVEDESGREGGEERAEIEGESAVVV